MRRDDGARDERLCSRGGTSRPAPRYQSRKRSEPKSLPSGLGRNRHEARGRRVRMCPPGNPGVNSDHLEMTEPPHRAKLAAADTPLGVILAGGACRRFGSPKALAMVGGRTIVERA